ncbi:hypothetical protein P8452_01091 [Trifolium repens]|nr:hypothetical protein P8452_01091 [Trifolium repens]
MKLALERALFKVCSGKDKGECIDEDKLKELTDQWKGEEWQNISKINTQNRKSKAGHNVHSGGSISAKEHAKTMRVELNREPTCFEVYQRMHKPKEKSNEWFNEEQALIAVGHWRSSRPVFDFGCGSVSAEEVRCWGLVGDSFSDKVAALEAKIEALTIELEQNNLEQETLKQKMQHWDRIFGRFVPNINQNSPV